jgi:hypothetical protein
MHPLKFPKAAVAIALVAAALATAPFAQATLGSPTGGAGGVKKTIIHV